MGESDNDENNSRQLNLNPKFLGPLHRKFFCQLVLSLLIFCIKSLASVTSLLFMSNNYVEFSCCKLIIVNTI
jgi:hypothetical protein